MAIVRPGKTNEDSLTTALDAGASGIVIPHCESAQEVKDMLHKIKYRKLRISDCQGSAQDIDYTIIH